MRIIRYRECNHTCSRWRYVVLIADNTSPLRPFLLLTFEIREIKKTPLTNFLRPIFLFINFGIHVGPDLLKYSSDLPPLEILNVCMYECNYGNEFVCLFFTRACTVHTIYIYQFDGLNSTTKKMGRSTSKHFRQFEMAACTFILQ